MPTQHPQPQGKRKWPVMVGVIVGVIVLVAGTFLVVNLSSSDDDNQANGANPPSAPGNTAPAPAGQAMTNILQERPGSGPAATFQGVPVYNACAILTTELLKSAGLQPASGYLTGGSRTSPDGDRAELFRTGSETSRCGGLVSTVDSPDGKALSSQVIFNTYNSKLTDDSTWERVANGPQGISGEANGITFMRNRGSDGHSLDISFGDGGDPQSAESVFSLSITHYADLPGGEATIQKLVEGVTKGIAAGPKPMPERSYPAPYNFTAKPCDAFPPDVFTTVTGQQTNGLQQDLFAKDSIPPGSGGGESPVQIRCERIGVNVFPNLWVEQTVFPTEQGAATAAKSLCTDAAGGVFALPTAIGDTSCGDSQGVLRFQAGRTVVAMTLTEMPKASAQASVAKMVPGAQKVFQLVNK